MNVLMLSPGFPAEMPMFTHGLAEVGVRVIGLGEQPLGEIPEPARSSMASYLQVRSLWDEESVIAEVGRLPGRLAPDRVECLWEPGVTLAAKLRHTFDLPGMREEQAVLFRDKGRMKQQLEAAGIRTPRHERSTNADEIRAAAEKVGYPLILKPIDGAGSANTHRVDGKRELDEILPRVRHLPELSVEEFIEGEEFTFDTICFDGQVAYCNVAWYRPPALIARSVESLSPQTVTLRNPDDPYVSSGHAMGLRVLEALKFRDGFTHMEWFRTASGEAVFVEIAARPPGARSVELMNYACDFDAFRGWAEAVCSQSFSQKVSRRYNSAIVFKRAQGQGRIQSIVGLERLIARYRESVACVDLLPVGSPRRNWKQTLISDGYVIVRHPDLQTTLEMADRFGSDLQLFAA